ncbi:MAG: hypothetical protein J6Y02_17975 [Pseudobutyrivibrio sp.]|nr:hypothetical protein [Pseudobutyrivibrio sp.]
MKGKDLIKWIKNINVDSNTVTIDGKPLQQFIIDTIVDGIKKYANTSYNRYVLYESQQQCIIDEKEVARQCAQASKEQIEEMQRKTAEMSINVGVQNSRNESVTIEEDLP